MGSHQIHMVLEQQSQLLTNRVLVMLLDGNAISAQLGVTSSDRIVLDPDGPSIMGTCALGWYPNRNPGSERPLARVWKSFAGTERKLVDVKWSKWTILAKDFDWLGFQLSNKTQCQWKENWARLSTWKTQKIPRTLGHWLEQLTKLLGLFRA